MKKINIFNRNINSPSYRRMPVSRGFNRGEGIPLFSGMTAVIFALFVATTSFAEPTELDKKTVASKAYVDTKQDMIPAAEEDYQSVLTDTDNDGVIGKLRIITADDLQDGELVLDDYYHAIPDTDAVQSELVNHWQPRITTGDVMFYDDPEGTEGDMYVPGLVAYDSQTSALSGNKIGILDYETILGDEGDLSLYSNFGGGYGSEMDNFVPTVRAVAEALQIVLDNMPYWTPLTWNNTQSVAINAYNTTFGTGTNQWAGSSDNLINGQFLANSLALKQNKITTGLVEFENPASGENDSFSTTFTSYDTSNGLVANKIGFVKIGNVNDGFGDMVGMYLTLGEAFSDNLVPSVAAVAQEMQYVWDKLHSLSWSNTQSVAINAYNTIFGTGTNNWAGNSADLIDGEFLANSLALKQNKIPAGTAGNVVTYSGTAGTVGSVATANAPTYNETTGVLENGTNIATIAAVDTRQKKMTCAGWDSETHTDEHCWLWSIEE